MGHGDRDGGVASHETGQLVKDEAGSGDLPGSGRDQPRRHGDQQSQLWTQEAQGGVPGGEQQVQVWRVRCVLTMDEW